MKIRPYLALLFLTCCLLFSQSAIPVSVYGQHPGSPITIKLEAIKMPPVVFPHAPHVERNKIACAVCHHRDPKEPKACTKCHDGKEMKGKTPVAKDVFHDKCIPCHRMNLEKEIKPPTRCSECHRK